MPDPYAQIHHFDHTCGYCDDEGDPLIGYYFEILASDGRQLCRLMGPYGSNEEAERACNCEWDRLGN